MSNFLIIAHRGASGKYPENSLLAFRKAVDAGVKWLELDVHLAADGELMVIHDETLQRTTNGRGPVGSMTSAELRQLDIGQGEQMPLLTEVLNLAAGRAKVNIELKGKGTALPVAELISERIVTKCQQSEDLLASSLYEEELIEFAARLPQVRVAPISEHPDQQIWQLAERLNAWSLHVAKATVDQQLIAEAQRQKRKLLVYTVNDMAEVQTLKALGVDGVFSDYPERLIGKQKEPFHDR